MSVLAPSRILRSALLSSLTILLLASYARAMVAAAPDTPMNGDPTKRIIEILAAIVAIISGIAAFVAWLCRIIKKWIAEAVKEGEERCQEGLAELERYLVGLLIQMVGMRPPAGPPVAPKQEAEAARDAFLDFVKRR